MGAQFSDAISEPKMKSSKKGIIEMQKNKCICHIIGQEEENGLKIGTGFFCKIPYKNNLTPVLITNYHIINDEFLEKNEYLQISLSSDEEPKKIKLDKDRKIYSSVKNEYDMIIIKLKEEHKIDNYLEIDENIFNKNSENIYESDYIYILHYPKKEKICVSYGNIFLKCNQFFFKHKCNTNHGSSGAPILNLSSNKVIGIHRGCARDEKDIIQFNIGTFLKYPLIELNTMHIIKKISNLVLNKKENKLIGENKNNEIIMEIENNEDNVNKDIHFSDGNNCTTKENV